MPSVIRATVLFFALLCTVMGCSRDDTHQSDDLGAPKIDASQADARRDLTPAQTDQTAEKGRDHGGADRSCHPLAAQTLLDVPYHSVSGVAQNLLSLDVGLPARSDCERLPVVIWVHGGSFYRGDKRGAGANEKHALFNGAGYIFVTINYRLSPYPPDVDDPKRVLYPTHPQDVARAVEWVVRYIAQHGGDPQRIALLGHSAGAHLVALVASDEHFLQDRGLALTTLRCAAPLDTAAFDIPLQMQSASEGMRTQKINAFGDDPKVWAQASPVNHVAAGKGMPSFLFVVRNVQSTIAQQQAFKDKLDAAGVSHSTISAPTLSHDEVNTLIGAPRDTIMTPPLMAFLQRCFADRE
jgi:arylformamidase